jgi:NitT/TauT family transport system ATP-binding protein
MDAQAPAIEISGLVKSYADVEPDQHVLALDRVDLKIGHGEFVSLIGPSGCGKTTLLKIVDGLLPYDGGEVTVRGRKVAGPGPERAVVFQSFALLPWRTVEGNIAFALELKGVKKPDAEEIVRRYVAMVGLQGFEHRYPRQLSGGMQQRVGLARALAVDPDILLMDEPFGALDAQTRTLLQADLERIWETDQKTVVFVTHAMDEAVFLSDRVVIMSPRPGRIHEIVEVDLPRPRGEEVRKHPRFVELTSYVWDVLKGMIVRAPEDSW